MDEETMRAAVEATETVVARVTTADLDRPTPCTEWTVRDLANHLVATLLLGRALLAGEEPSVDAGPGQVPSEDLVGNDLAAAYRAAAGPLLAATTAEAVGQVHETPLGAMPGTLLAGFTALDIAVHGWDLATATGRPHRLDPALAEHLLDFARRTISDELGTRAPRIGPEVAAPGGAGGTARLVAFLGRRP
jgi:uncharacterized protein (TIGR03086 family)